MEFQSIVGGFFELAFLATAFIYFGLVVVNYREGGPHPRPQFDRRDPARSAERWAEWLGVKALALAVKVGTPILAMLSEASAEVGEWFLERRHNELQ
ncbi:MAG: hypothetical protein WAO35_26590 [Terriglobia bacterium]